MFHELSPTIDTAHFSPTEERAILTVTCLAVFLFFNSFGSIGVALPAGRPRRCSDGGEQRTLWGSFAMPGLKQVRAMLLSSVR
ncbi:MAG TPA: hypothetical protein VF977_15735 [Candidatus Binatia bacterium]